LIAGVTFNICVENQKNLLRITSLCCELLSQEFVSYIKRMLLIQTILHCQLY